MKQKELDELFYREVIKPTLIVALTPLAFSILIIILGLRFSFLKFETSVLIGIFSLVWGMFILIIGLGGGGLDFKREHGEVKC